MLVIACFRQIQPLGHAMNPVSDIDDWSLLLSYYSSETAFFQDLNSYRL